MGAACVAQVRGGLTAAFGTPEDARSREIDRDLDIEKKKKILKILLLGPGESGKSTTLKQMKIIHSEGYSQDDLIAKRHVVYHNLLNGIVTSVREVNDRNIPITEAQQHDAEMCARFYEKLRTEDVHPLDSNVCNAISRLYESDAVQQIIYRTENTDVDEAGQYFLENLARIRKSDFVPTVLDVLKSRVATQGCVMMNFFIKDFTFNVFDVGGQRSQRKKWLHIFDNVHAVLFITSLSEYNQTLFEDKETNRMRESLNLFGNICRNEYFRQTAIILFLNKMDLFADKIKKYPITVVFPRYKGPQEFDECLAHITKRFLRENTNTKRQIYTHNTCATDTKQIQVVIDSVIDVIIQQTMQKIGIQ